jgi:hypothetical protein
MLIIFSATSNVKLKNIARVYRQLMLELDYRILFLNSFLLNLQKQNYKGKMQRSFQMPRIAKKNM